MRKIKRNILLVIVFAGLYHNLPATGFIPAFDDGPYLFREDDRMIAVFIKDHQVIRDTLVPQPDNSYLLDWSDGYANPVNLQESFGSPVTSFQQPERFLVISDLHGNLNGTIELLLAAGVMDTTFNWIYNGWLIVDGDIFDRGEQVTSCLWLLYHLYQQAENDPDGKLIPVLGNHENMTIGKHIHKVEGKYQETCELLGMNYNELYGENTFLGSWLRSWQTILLLGDYLFVHGGISAGFAERFNSPDSVNILISDYYHGRSVDQASLDYLFSNNGPFWYRGYFSTEEKWEKSDPEIIERILKKYNLKNIIVGHTTFESIQFAQEGLVIAIDAGLKYQNSGQALLFQSGRFFMLASSGVLTELTPGK